MRSRNISSGPEPGARQMRGSVDRSLRLRVRIFAIIALVSGTLLVIDLVRLDGRGTAPVLLALLAGLTIGLIASRIYALRWDGNAAKVVGRIDTVGAALLICYIIVMLLRGQLVEMWIAAPVTGAAGFAVLSGLMIGQVIGTVRGIVRLLFGSLSPR